MRKDGFFDKSTLLNDLVMLLAFVVYFIFWKSLIVFFIMALIIFLIYVYRKPTKKQILSNFVALIVFWLVIFVLGSHVL
jgi:uncharacterized membrane protein